MQPVPQGTCAGEPKSRFRASSKWHHRVSPGCEILSACSIDLKTSICAEIARWHALWSKSRGAEMAIFCIFGFKTKSAILGDFQEKAKLAIFRAPNRSKTFQNGVKPPPNTLETSSMSLCPRSENRKIFSIFRVLAQDFRPKKTENLENRNFEKSQFQPFRKLSS